MILLNSHEVKFEKFPYAEVKLVIDEDKIKNGSNTVTFMYESDDDLIKLMFVKRELECYFYCSEIFLDIAFMPYARMDRVDDKTCFTLKYVSDFINFLNFKAVNIFEPHSDVCVALINKCKQIELTKFLFHKSIEDNIISFNEDVDFVCYPDATAHKRYSKIGDFNAAIGMKSRDFTTGWINSLDIFIPNEKHNDGIGGKNVVILDDLCSKGGTFMMTAKVLKQMGANNVTLIVGHCEPSILDGDVLNTDLIDCVITSNTILDPKLEIEFDKMFIYDFTDCKY